MYDDKKHCEFLRQQLEARHSEIYELKEEAKSLKSSNLWLAFAGLTGWGGIIVICANFWG